MNPTLACLLFAAATLSAQTVPDFQLPDVNPNSPRYDTAVSPRDYRLQVSGYYFGAAH
jgi:hypothetical protein